MDTFRCSGPGGQNINKRDTGVRLTHIESGLSAECREHRTQKQNRDAAFYKLADKLIKHYFPKSRKSTHAPQKEIRVYHEPDDRVVDEFGTRFSYKEVIVKGKAKDMINSHTLNANQEKGK